MVDLGDGVIEGADVTGPFLADGQGVASSRWVRPIFTTSAHCLVLASMASGSRLRAEMVFSVAMV